MTSKRKLLKALGPFLIACFLLVMILFSPFKWFKEPTEKDISKAASSMSINVIKGNALKNSAVKNHHYMPFFGSSELSRVNAFHPSVLARKYQRDYEPFLLGAPGTQSFSHFLMIHSMGEELKDQPIVFIISPQWFVKEGVSDQMFSLYYSPLQTYQWLMGLETITEAEQAIAKRLLTFSSITSDTTLSRLLNKIVDGEKPTALDLKTCQKQFELLSREDLLFYHIDRTSKEAKIEKAMTKLPDTYNYQELDKLAFDIGKKGTSNNDFQIANSFYSNRLLPVKDNLKNSQTNFNYLKSPEFSDFQLVLNELDKYNIDALFVIPPVNEKWSDYTGLSQDMLNNFSKKITHQLTSQGFDNIADFTYKRGEDYFMEDTIHLGWRGWLEMDQYVQQFLKNHPTQKNAYHLDNETFLSEEWQTKEDI